MFPKVLNMTASMNLICLPDRIWAAVIIDGRCQISAPWYLKADEAGDKKETVIWRIGAEKVFFYSRSAQMKMLL